jgi:hypothetical protein
MTFLEYAAAMVGCYSALPPQEREELNAWEAQHVDGSGAYGTSKSVCTLREEASHHWEVRQGIARNN